MDEDEGLRGSSGVVMSLLDLAETGVRIYMDDVHNDSSPSRGPWIDRGLVTFKDYELEDLEELNLSEKELADLGAYVIARLMATKKHPHK